MTEFTQNQIYDSPRMRVGKLSMDDSQPVESFESDAKYPHEMPAKITWEELKKYHLGKPARKLPRDLDIQQKYDEYVTRLKQHGINISDDIIRLYFEEQMNSELIVVPNMFPYYLEDGIKQSTIWINPEFKFDQETVWGFIKNNIHVDENKIVLFKNQPEYGSVVDIDHYHIFING